jgi:hypothetical protein
MEHIDMWHLRKKILVIAVLGVVTVAVAGIAIAAWTVSGTGTGYAKASTASAVTLADATANTSADLYPGASGAVKLKVSNPNPFPVRITAVAGNGAITSDKGAACNAATGVAFTNQSSLTLDLLANETDKVFTLAGAVAMTNASDNTCQGAVFSIPVSVTAISNA